jgi:hypothetical protein
MAQLTGVTTVGVDLGDHALGLLAPPSPRASDLRLGVGVPCRSMTVRSVRVALEVLEHLERPSA